MRNRILQRIIRPTFKILGNRNLEESFESISPCIVGFMSKLNRSRVGQQPIFPSIIATGFMVDKSGIAVTNRHVIQTFNQFPYHPKTGEFSVGAFLFLQGDNGKSMQFVAIPLKGWWGLESWESTGDWYGQPIPDIGFVQLEIREVPFLKLATEDFYLRVGMRVSTVGYPMGALPLTVLGKINQAMPFLRQGIVSSVFPFPIAKPHGFTIDIMQQGGSSGSPIFALGDEAVIGMMSSSVLDTTIVQSQQGAAFAIPQNTNISIAESAHIIQLALDGCRKNFSSSVDGIPTLEEVRARYPEGTTPPGLEWESLGTFGPG
jgi:S1-C subfamily serine protease